MVLARVVLPEPGKPRTIVSLGIQVLQSFFLSCKDLFIPILMGIEKLPETVVPTNLKHHTLLKGPTGIG
jgi:hypothetical protein